MNARIEDTAARSDWPDRASPSDRLNANCFCRTLDVDSLQDILTGVDRLDSDIARALAARPGLFSNVAVYLPAAAIHHMEVTARAIEAVAALPLFRRAVHARSAQNVAPDFGPTGVFMGYDFHVHGAAARLIEVNTNAGGAFLNAALARAQASCCTDQGQAASLSDGFDAAVVRMFGDEWRKQGRSGTPSRVAIVDDKPTSQFLYPELLLAQRLLQANGIDAPIVDAGTLDFRGGQLFCDAGKVDLVYNRLTDFALEDPAHAALRAAYVAGSIVLTPGPAIHALFADKRNLITFSDAAELRRLGASDDDIKVLIDTVPKTQLVDADNDAALWKDRRDFFFKPAAGYASKAAYRGDKLTKGVWATILESSYVAQAFTPPSQRSIQVEGSTTALKADIRLYRYASRSLLFAARLYQGQTTNFRTPGGGFAPVFVLDAAVGGCAQ
jgi:hypothetical protein